MLARKPLQGRTSTDAGKEIKFDEKEKPGISNLLTIHSAFSGKAIKEIENEFAGKGYGDFKLQVAEVVVEALNPIRIKTQELMNASKISCYLKQKPNYKT